MGYKEKLKSFAEGKLEGREKEKVESDIDRQRAIGDYLEESTDGDIFEVSKDNDEKHAEEDGEFSKLVQKAVSRKLKRFGIWTGAIVLAIALFLMFGLSPLMDVIYYDPGTALPEPDSTYSSIDVPLSVYTELHCPGKYFGGTVVEDEGFARYKIELTFITPGYSSNFFARQVYQFVIDKGETHINGPDWRESGPRPFFSRSGFGQDDTLEIASKANAAKLDKLPETAMVTAALTFRDDLSLGAVNGFRSDETMVTFIAIKTREEDADYPTAGNFGIAPNWGLSTIDNNELLEEYPHLFLGGIDETDIRFTVSGWKGTPDTGIWETHFKSMLKYMNDQKEFRQVIGYNEYQSYQYDYASALKYTQENGVKTYGVIVYGPVEEILRMAKDDRVKMMFVMDAQLISINHWAW